VTTRRHGSSWIDSAFSNQVDAGSRDENASIGSGAPPARAEWVPTRLGWSLRRIDGRGPGGHHLGRAGAYSNSALTPRGVAAMMKNVVAGCVVAALIFMGLLAYAQEHHECWHGHLLKTVKSCGSVDTSM
jgi:hypothetical protein